MLCTRTIRYYVYRLGTYSTYNAYIFAPESQTIVEVQCTIMNLNQIQNIENACTFCVYNWLHRML